uniref:Ycf55 n=1 Tax=Sebdenia flabellata TaxID=42024 RepID=A0A1C9CA02_9FLOR|nr:hypothetical protein Sebd_123 [Sebdenia flabellata]AOM65210.1 hypothetical protein Sebd_123 [Sebdenia flabellata]
MIKYWPNKKSVYLNNEVAHLFISTKQKLSLSLLNVTDTSLYIDILDTSSKQKLFFIVLGQLEILILDIIELDLSLVNIKLLNRKILYDLIQKALVNFLKIFCSTGNSINFVDTKKYYYVQIILLEHKLLLENLLIYLLFGSNSINSKIFAFYNNKTPIKHVSILLENFIIQASNLVIFMLFENMNSLSQLAYFLMKNNICSSIYLSTRSIALFRNNLMWQNFLYLYINQPKDIYSSRYRVWLINPKGLHLKYIYTSRLDNLEELSSIKYLFIFLLEVQDVVIPQLEKILLMMATIILYIFINIIGNSIIFFIRAIMSGLYSHHK